MFSTTTSNSKDLSFNITLIGPATGEFDEVRVISGSLELFKKSYWLGELGSYLK